MADIQTTSRSWPWRHVAWARPARATALAWAGTAAVLAAAPFERIDARLLLVPGQALTNVEAVVVAALGIWGVALLAGGRAFVWRTPITAPAVLFLLVLGLAAIAAPAHQANALKVTGRFAAGLAVCLLAINAATSTDRAATLMRVAAASGALVGVIAMLEYLRVPLVLQWLTHFRETAHAVGGTLRMTSTLQYPTIASMYLEVVFAFALALLVLDVDRRANGRAVLMAAAILVIAEAIILTLTRAGLITMAASIAIFLAGLTRRRGFDRACRAIVAIAALVAVCLATSPAAPWRARLTTEGHDDWYRATWETPSGLRMQGGEWQRVPVTVRNDGLVVWRSDEDPPFMLSYHWLTESGDRVVQFDGQRTGFPKAVAPGDTVTLLATVRAPERPGRYRLMWDIVQEQRLWFSTERSPTAVTPVEVAGRRAGPAQAPPPTMALPAASVRLGRLALWRLAAAMIVSRPLLGVGPDNFRLLYGAQAKIDRPDVRVHTNNMYLELFVGAGILGGLLFLWLLWRAALPLARSLRAAGGRHFVASLGAAAALAAVLIHGLVDSFLTFTPTYVLIWITLGLAVRLAGPPGDSAHADRV